MNSRLALHHPHLDDSWVTQIARNVVSAFYERGRRFAVC